MTTMINIDAPSFQDVEMITSPSNETYKTPTKLSLSKHMDMSSPESSPEKKTSWLSTLFTQKNDNVIIIPYPHSLVHMHSSCDVNKCIIQRLMCKVIGIKHKTTVTKSKTTLKCKYTSIEDTNDVLKFKIEVMDGKAVMTLQSGSEMLFGWAVKQLERKLHVHHK